MTASYMGTVNSVLAGIMCWLLPSSQIKLHTHLISHHNFIIIFLLCFFFFKLQVLQNTAVHSSGPAASLELQRGTLQIADEMNQLSWVLKTCLPAATLRPSRIRFTLLLEGMSMYTNCSWGATVIVEVRSSNSPSSFRHRFSEKDLGLCWWEVR